MVPEFFFFFFLMDTSVIITGTGTFWPQTLALAHNSTLYCQMCTKGYVNGLSYATWLKTS